MRNELNKVLNQTKEHICRYLTEIYLHNNNNTYPNWDEDEEIIVTNDEIGNITIEIEVDEYNNDDNIPIIEKEKRVINHFIVTLDNNLFFNIIDKFEEQYEWTDISADELIGIFEFIRKKYKEIFG